MKVPDETVQASGGRSRTGISGVYRIPPGSTDVEIGGSTPLGIRLDEISPIPGIAPMKVPKVRRNWAKLVIGTATIVLP